jgi:hypothetical protein
MKKLLLLLLIFVSLANCRSSKTTEYTGKYTWVKVNKVERSCYLFRHNFNIFKVNASTVMAIYLFRDSTFVISYCDKKIRFSGNYLIKEDSIYYNNVYSYYHNKPWKLKPNYFNKKKQEIIQTSKNDSVGYIPTLTILRKNNSFYKGEVIDSINGYLMNKEY